MNSRPNMLYVVISHRWKKGFVLEEPFAGENHDKFFEKQLKTHCSIMFKSSDGGVTWSVYKKKGVGAINKIMAAHKQLLADRYSSKKSNSSRRGSRSSSTGRNGRRNTSTGSPRSPRRRRSNSASASPNVRSRSKSAIARSQSPKSKYRGRRASGTGSSSPKTESRRSLDTSPTGSPRIKRRGSIRSRRNSFGGASSPNRKIMGTLLHLRSSVPEVSIWLRSIPEYAQYADAFEDNEIDGQALHNITNKLARKMGIKNMEHWIDISTIARSLKEPKSLSATQHIYVINGFYMAMRDKFTKPNVSIHYYEVEWDIEKLSWEDFLWKIIGSNDPSAAIDGSIHRVIHEKFKEFGLNSAPTVDDNVIHASVSPFAALCERVNWLSRKFQDDEYGKALLNSGINLDTLEEWKFNPKIFLDGKRASLYGTLEHTNADQCIAHAQQITGVTLSPCEVSKNQCFLFIQPQVATQQIKDFVTRCLVESNIKIVHQGSLDAAVIEEKKIIDNHYHAISKKACLYQPKDLRPLHRKKEVFFQLFGVSWESALENNLIFNAMDACKRFEIDNHQMSTIWNVAEERKQVITFSSDFKCAKVIVEIEEINLTRNSSVKDVNNWLMSDSKLQAYASAFADASIDGNALAYMNRGTSKELGVKKIGHWMKIKEMINRIHMNDNKKSPRQNNQKRRRKRSSVSANDKNPFSEIICPTCDEKCSVTDRFCNSCGKILSRTSESNGSRWSVGDEVEAKFAGDWRICQIVHIHYNDEIGICDYGVKFPDFESIIGKDKDEIRTVVYPKAEVCPLTVGTTVVIKGLETAAHYNGQRAVIYQAYHCASDRYGIQLLETGKQLSICPDNISIYIAPTTSRKRRGSEKHDRDLMLNINKLSIGTGVLIKGLQSASQYNGEYATIFKSYDSTTGRYGVLLACSEKKNISPSPQSNYPYQERKKGTRKKNSE